MNHARSPKQARLEAHVAIAMANGSPSGAPDLEEDVRRVVPAWAEVLELVEGAKQRGWDDHQIDYLLAVIGVTWTKAYRKGQADAGSK